MLRVDGVMNMTYTDTLGLAGFSLSRLLSSIEFLTPANEHSGLYQSLVHISIPVLYLCHS